MTIRAHGNPFFLPSLANLWSFQAGYRWNGMSGAPIEDWNDDWLVVADEGGDPFILVRSSGLILHSYVGAGLYEAREIFPDLNTMAACLATIGSIVREAGDAYKEKDCSIRPEFSDLAADRFRKLLGSTAATEAALIELEWR